MADKKEKKEMAPGFKRNLFIIGGSVALILVIVGFMYASNQKKLAQVAVEHSIVQQTGVMNQGENNTPPAGLSEKLLEEQKAKSDAAKSNGNSFIGTPIEQRVLDAQKEKERLDAEKRLAEEQARLANGGQPNPSANMAVVSGVQEVSSFAKPTNGNSSLSLNFEEERYLQLVKISNAEVDKLSPKGTDIGVEIMSVTPKNQTTSVSSSVPAVADILPGDKLLLGKMGDRYYAQLQAGIKSDLTSPVIANLISGPARGSKISGSFARSPDGTMSLIFNKLSVGDGRQFALSAIAINQENGIPAIEGDVKNHYFERLVIPVTAAVLNQYGQLQAQQGTTTTLPANALQGQTVVRNLTPQQMRSSALGTGASEGAKLVSEQAALAKPTTTLNQNLLIMIMLTDDLVMTNKGVLEKGSISK